MYACARADNARAAQHTHLFTATMSTLYGVLDLRLYTTMLRWSVVRIWYGFASLSPGRCLVLGRTNTAGYKQARQQNSENVASIFCIAAGLTSVEAWVWVTDTWSSCMHCCQQRVALCELLPRGVVCVACAVHVRRSTVYQHR